MQLPEPKIELVGTEQRVDHKIPEKVAPILEAPKRDDGRIARIQRIWNITQVVVAEAIETANELQELKTPKEEKAYVKAEVVRWLRLLEKKYDLIPGLLEKLAFKLINYGLGLIINRTYGKLRR